MAEFRAFRDQETVLLTAAVPAITWVAVWAAGTATVGIALAVSPWSDRTDLRWMFLSLVTFAVVSAARIPRVRLRFAGERFEVRWYWGSAKGAAGEFLGWKHGALAHTFLLRREDLKWVELPALAGGKLYDEHTERWVRTFLPSIDQYQLDAVRDERNLPREILEVLLERALAEKSKVEGFSGSRRDLMLARAALSIELSRHVELGEHLTGLVPCLPDRAVALPFVLSALRVVGNQATAAVLEPELALRELGALQHLARTFCALAMHAQRQSLERLFRWDDPFVSRQAERALRRLDAAPHPAEKASAHAAPGRTG